MLETQAAERVTPNTEGLPNCCTVLMEKFSKEHVTNAWHITGYPKEEVVALSHWCFGALASNAAMQQCSNAQDLICLYSYAHFHSSKDPLDPSSSTS
jgi:hypothetical protein